LIKKSEVFEGNPDQFNRTYSKNTSAELTLLTRRYTEALVAVPLPAADGGVPSETGVISSAVLRHKTSPRYLSAAAKPSLMSIFSQVEQPSNNNLNSEVKPSVSSVTSLLGTNTAAVVTRSDETFGKRAVLGAMQDVTSASEEIRANGNDTS
jgi:hypothetical protein